jgi:hypothetical protein
MTKPTAVSFNWNAPNAKREVISETVLESGFYNLKNKAEGPRRYAFRSTVVKYTNDAGQVAFSGEMQALLNGSRYQSGKDVLISCEGGKTRYCSDEQYVREALGLMIAGSLKRYAKLAQDPANKIEARF